MNGLHLTHHGRHVTVLEIDNPPANALGRDLRRALMAALEQLESDLDNRCVVLTGRGTAFCSGDDLKEQLAAQDEGAAAREAQLAEFAGVLERVARFRAPVIAAVNGWCMGGGLELALCCDIRIASATARFAAAGVNIGLMASVWRLPRLIGEGRAKHMLLTGSPIDAATADRFGLVSAVHEADVLRTEALALAERIATRAPLSVEASKCMASRALDLSPQDAANATKQGLDALVRSADHAEALAAFRDKRDPKFTRK